MKLRCSAFRCDNEVLVTDDDMSDPAWRRYHVHCPEHQLLKSRAQRRGPGMKQDKLLKWVAKLEAEMEADPPNGEEEEEHHAALTGIISAARAGMSERPTAQQAAWVVKMFMDNADCTFSRKVEIMFPDDGGALYALHSAGGGSLSNILFESVDEDSGVRRALKFIDEEAEWSKPTDHIRELLRETLHG